MRRIRFLDMIGLVATIMLGCNGSMGREVRTMSTTLENPGIVVLVPFFVSRPDKSGRRVVRCPGCEGYMTIGEIAPEGPQVITDHFRRKLSRIGYTLASEEMVEEIFPSLRHLEQKPGVLAQKIALELQADSVILGWTFQYRERIGGDWGAERPASVTFVAVLLDGRSGRLLWHSKFDETQRPLSENILHLPTFLRRGGRWVTASELASDGVGHVLLRFPGRDDVRVNP
ncbi:MAG: hypothetical protein GTN81_14705 [Proteobacteria bacterium]|nr:hypothetical protein [Pseudomonadota bacterium]